MMVNAQMKWSGLRWLLLLLFFVFDLHCRLCQLDQRTGWRCRRLLLLGFLLLLLQSELRDHLRLLLVGLGGGDRRQLLLDQRELRGVRLLLLLRGFRGQQRGRRGNPKGGGSLQQVLRRRCCCCCCWRCRFTGKGTSNAHCLE